jgi:hypothetical protein
MMAKRKNSDEIEIGHGNPNSNGESMMPVDVDDDRAGLIFSSLAETHESLTTEIAANEESANSLVRHTGAQKFQREDPIEAASAEMILQYN